MRGTVLTLASKKPLGSSLALVSASSTSLPTHSAAVTLPAAARSHPSNTDDRHGPAANSSTTPNVTTAVPPGVPSGGVMLRAGRRRAPDDVRPTTDGDHDHDYYLLHWQPGTGRRTVSRLAGRARPFRGTVVTHRRRDGGA